mgnify:FL=1
MADDCKWWLDPLPYKVFGGNGRILYQAPLSLRHPPRLERELMDGGCSIWINGKRLTRKEVAQRGQAVKV